MEAGGRKRKVRVNLGHHQHYRDKAQNSGTVPPIPGRLATMDQPLTTDAWTDRHTHRYLCFIYIDDMHIVMR